MKLKNQINEEKSYLMTLISDANGTENILFTICYMNLMIQSQQFPSFQQTENNVTEMYLKCSESSHRRMDL